MDLSVHDRLILIGTLKAGAPTTGNLITMKVVHNLEMALSFSEEEIAEKKLQINEAGLATWLELAPKDIEIGPVGMGIIRQCLRDALPKWDKAEELTVAHISLFERFDVDMELQSEEVQ